MSRYFLLAMIITLSLAAGAQETSGTLRIGVLDLDRLMTESAVIRRTVESVQDEVKKEQESINDQLNRYKILSETFEQQKTILTEEQKQSRRKEIEELKIAIEEQQDKVNRIIKRSERRLLEPTLARVDEAIRAVGREGGWDLILKNDSVLYGSARVSVTDAVIKMIEKMEKESPLISTSEEEPATSKSPTIGETLPDATPTPTSTF